MRNNENENSGAKNTVNPLGTAPVGRLLLQYAIPSIISTLIASLYNMVDQMFIGQRIGFLGNAATTVAYPLTFLCGAMTLLFSNGSSVNFNICNGRGEKDEALHFAGAGLTLLAAEGIFTAALVLFFTPWFVNLFGATDQVYPYALTYMKLVAPGLPFLALTSGGTLLIRSDGSPRYALICSMSGVALNFVLDYLFLFPMNMGIAGAALATVMGQVLSALMVAAYMLHFRTGRLRREHFAVSGSRFRQITSIGAAGSLNQAAMLVMNLVLNSSLRYYGSQSVYGGSEALAAAGVVTKVNFLFYSTIIGCSIGGQPIMGFNFGARNYERVKKTAYLVFAYAFVIGAAVTACFWLFPEQILRLFGDSAGGYQAFALRYMHEFMLLVILAGVLPVAMNAMVSIRQPLKGVIISLSKQLVLIVLLLILPRFLGIDGILIAGPVADLMVAIAAFIVIRSAFSRLGKTPAAG
ncbi:putative efflux protein, MATE family [Sarcina sp. DSM 11001]|uniref:MATE family efflux transporter n=1 Tax=Sarcina sp. DSM 11001 TaxID=1798184 RepID=UPI00087E7D3E|nr:MATE family efflux transporter [Sarcina sp. DSM 11001]SDL20651.1 putative efflux protein, MATE family [Sarcina sp. DSM 11001]